MPKSQFIVLYADDCMLLKCSKNPLFGNIFNTFSTTGGGCREVMPLTHQGSVVKEKTMDILMPSV